jgi:2'-5' RNA ligase
MSPRHRLGVALLIDLPVATEVEGLRRALGDGSLEAVAAHVTLVPPVNVRSSELGAAIDVVRHAAYRQERALELVLGPVATFAPVTPVVYLAVDGGAPNDMADLHRLHQAVLAGPLQRSERWPWVPHVTLADDAPAERIDAALVALRSYRAEVVLDRVVLLEETGRRWSALADACFGPPAVFGRGGLELEITEGRTCGPDALDMVAAAGLGDEAGAVVATLRRPDVLLLTGRRQGRPVGLAVAWGGDQRGAPGHAGVVVEPGARGQGVGRALLVALEARARAAGWAAGGVCGHGPPAFFTSSSAWIRDFGAA